MITWTLPWPVGCSVNHLYERSRNGGNHLNPRARNWREHAILILRQSGLALPPGRVAVGIDYWPPRDGRLHDPDNLAKTVIDALFLAAGETDNRVWRVESTRHDPDGNPRLVVGVWAFAEGDGDG